MNEPRPRQSAAATIWSVVGILVILAIVGSVITAYRQQHNPSSCPSGYTWSQADRQCEYGWTP